MRDLSLKIATKDDVSIIQSLANKIWRKNYPAIISLAQIDYMLEKIYSAQSLYQQMSEGAVFLICYASGKEAGFCSYNKQGNGNFFLHKLYVDTEMHHEGIGTWLLNEIFGKKDDLVELRLTVNRLNYKAINFYFKNGFVIEKVKDLDIGNGYWMNDFVMIKKYRR